MPVVNVMPTITGNHFPDVNGKHINAHGGNIIKAGDTYYWYGEHRGNPKKADNKQKGVVAYKSPDLQNWTPVGVVLEVSDEEGHPLERGCIIERPKVVYNPATGKYVMWFHHEMRGVGYGSAYAGVAVSDSPEGPFTFLRTGRVNPGILPMGYSPKDARNTWSDTLTWWTPTWRKAIEEGMLTFRDKDKGQMSRDMTIYIDDDGKAYHIYSSEENLTLQIAELDSTYLNHTGKYIRIFPGGHNEAPAIFKKDGTYWMITSGCTGWAPNEARLMRADNIWGPWEQLPNPCKGELSELTFRGQSTYIYDNDGRYYFMADVWNPQNLSVSRHLWLPIDFDDNGVPVIYSPYRQEPRDNYLMVYFTDPDHSVHFATSPDGYTFTSLNNGMPIIAGDTIADQKGIRDPHIGRGADGAFYMAMTDLHIFGKEKGYRDTQWERPAEQYSWGNNRGLVLMKSYDLINWTRSNVRIADLFPEKFGDVGCVWAPQTVWDDREQRPMIYFTMRIGNGKTKLYYAYTDYDFTTLVTEPKELFEYPNPEIQILDGDLTQMPDGNWCLSFVAQDGQSGIRQAFGPTVTGPWTYEDVRVDFAGTSCEAPNMFRRAGTDTYVLLYDIFGRNPHNFGFAETTDFKNYTNIGELSEGVMTAPNFDSPKHGAIVPITETERRRLEMKWRPRHPRRR